jgi:hypothetical protein
MHVAIRRYSMDPEVLRDLKSRIEADFLPELKRVTGFVSYYVVTTGSDTLDTISCFETREGERKSTQLAAEFVRRNYPEKRVERVGIDEGPCIIEQHAAVLA